MNTWRMLSIIVVLLMSFAAFDWIFRYRQENSEDLQLAIRNVEQLSSNYPDWVGESAEFDPLIVRVAGCKAYRSWIFTNTENNRQINCTIMVGTPGQMSEHLPEICFQAVGYRLITGSFQKPVLNEEFPKSGLNGELAKMEMQNGSEIVQIWHGWHDGKHWSRPDYARFRFSGSTFLFRFSMNSTTTEFSNSSDDATNFQHMSDFIEEVLPLITDELQKDLR